MKTYDNLIKFCTDRELNQYTKIVVPYRESYFSETEFLKLVITGNSLFASDDGSGIDVQVRIDTVQDLMICMTHAKYNSDNNTLSPIYDKFGNGRKISPSLYRNKTFRTGGSDTKGFVYKDEMIMLDIIF